jgi:hypothetical protein
LISAFYRKCKKFFKLGNVKTSLIDWSFRCVRWQVYCCQHHERKTTCLDIFLLSDRQWGTEHQYLLSRFLGDPILQLLVIYRIYDQTTSGAYAITVTTSTYSRRCGRLQVIVIWGRQENGWVNTGVLETMVLNF